MPVILLVLLGFFQDGSVLAEKQSEPYAYQAKTDLGVLSIEIASPIIYLPRSGSTSILSFCNPKGLVKDGVPVEVKGGFLNTKPKPVRPIIDKSDDYKIEEIKDSLMFVFSKEGKIALNLLLGEQAIKVPLEVKKLPIDEDDTDAKVVEAFGLPDDTSTHFVKWPKNECHNGVFYVVSASQSIRKIEQWRYEKMPYLVISMESGKVVSIDSVAENPTDEFRFKDAYQRELLKRVRDRFNQDLNGGQNPNPPPNSKMGNQPGDNTNKASSIDEYHTWTDNQGKVTKAKFVRYADLKVFLLTEDGSNIVIRLNNLTKESADLARKFIAQTQTKPKKR